MYFVKLNSSGEMQWTRTVGAAGSDVAWSVIQTSDGGFTAAGYTSSFGAGLQDMCIISLDAGGTLQWSKTIGGTFYDDAWSINQTSDSGYIIGGRTNSFGPLSYDMFIVKLGPAGNSCSNSNNAAFSSGTGGTISSITPISLSITFAVTTQSPSIASGGALLTEICTITGKQPVSNEITHEYVLHQNYPNPFNPMTNIEFAIPKSSFVKLVIYDAIGRAVETLLSGQLNAGIYKAGWNASAYPSGVYFYKLDAEGFTETRKMILVK
ncbi:MAG: T9SS type A sorting domain-containing protein [Chlorobi bacterium]|nr:T9SS type A sorting domain-containing protein [Chlorobiota bacterium]